MRKDDRHMEGSSLPFPKSCTDLQALWTQLTLGGDVLSLIFPLASLVMDLGSLIIGSAIGHL